MRTILTFVALLGASAAALADPYGTLRARIHDGNLFVTDDTETGGRSLQVSLSNGDVFVFVEMPGSGRVVCLSGLVRSGMPALSFLDRDCDGSPEAVHTDGEQYRYDGGLSESYDYITGVLGKLGPATEAASADRVTIPENHNHRKPADFDAIRTEIAGGQQKLAYLAHRLHPERADPSRLDIAVKSGNRSFGMRFRAELVTGNENCRLTYVVGRHSGALRDPDCDGFYEKLRHKPNVPEMGFGVWAIARQQDYQERMLNLVSALITVRAKRQ